MANSTLIRNSSPNPVNVNTLEQSGVELNLRKEISPLLSLFIRHALPCQASDFQISLQEEEPFSLACCHRQAIEAYSPSIKAGCTNQILYAITENPSQPFLIY